MLKLLDALKCYTQHFSASRHLSHQICAGGESKLKKYGNMHNSNTKHNNYF
jgi:hypothetical protein